MLMELNMKFLKSYYILLVNIQLWEELLMLNYKLFTKLLKVSLNKKLYSLSYMKKDPVLSYKLSKKWIS